MDADHKKILKALSLELRHLLEGWYDNAGRWHAGDLEQRLNALGVWRDRKPVPADELAHLSPADREARQVVDAYLKLRQEAEVERGEAVAEFVRETAYTWANRLLALRCMEARGLIDEVILQKLVYGGRSLAHHRLAQRQPELCLGEDGGLFAMLDRAFERQAEHLPLLFDPRAPGVALQPSVPAIKRAIALLSGTEAMKGQDPAGDEVFRAPDALGWAYQYWNTEEKDRVFETVRTRRGAKIEGAGIIPATQLYTEPYMVKFLVQNSLGALWMGMYPESRLCDKWEYYVRDADRAPVKRKPVREITFLDPAVGSGHFLLEAFDLFYDMYLEEGEVTEPEAICALILENNLFGIDIDERAVQIAEAALWMKAAERAFGFKGVPANLVATNIRLPRGKDHLEAFLREYPEDRDLRPALEIIFEGLEHADELGSLLQIEEPVEKELRYLQAKHEERMGKPEQLVMFDEMRQPQQGELPLGTRSYEDWKVKNLIRLREHFATEAQTPDLVQHFFSRSAGMGLALFDLLVRRYDVVAANPPYLGTKKLTSRLKNQLAKLYPQGRNDLMTIFFVRLDELRNSQGTIAFVSNAAFMWLQLHEDIRRYLLRQAPPTLVVHLGYFAFQEMRDHVDGVLYISDSGRSSWTGWFCLPKGYDKPRDLRNVLSSRETGGYFTLDRDAFDKIPGQSFLYEQAEYLHSLYTRYPSLAEVAPAKSGLQTSNVRRFVRSWWETRGSSDDRWTRYVKGGDPIPWCESDTYMVDWEFDGVRIKIEAARRYGSVTRTVKNQEYYFRSGYTFSLSSGYDLAVRRLSDGYIFDVSSPTVFIVSDEYEWVFAFLNSAHVSQIIALLNPTMHVTVADVARLPLPELDEAVAITLVHLSEEAESYVVQLLSLWPTTVMFDPIQIRKEIDVLIEMAETVFAKLLSTESQIDHMIAKILNSPREPKEKQVGTQELIPSRNSIVASQLTAILLQLLGHRWPKQIETGKPVPDWADADGIIPLTQNTDEPTLLDRVRQRIAAEFPGGDVTAIEREFAESMGKPLDLWLTTEFFEHHTSQFKKRPIAWQIQSGRFTTRQQPAFACLVYYHKLNNATLATIQSQYVRPLRQRYATELRGLEGIAREARSAQQDARRVELEGAIQELSEFDAALERVARQGFASTALDKIIEKEPLDRWCSMDGVKPPPASREALLRQEQGYTPDLNDGVRVNIAPLQKAGLLAANVLSAKDMDKALADRAEWRADERRWCREGKLPKPGWWGP